MVEPGVPEDRESALKPLLAAAPALSALRSGELEPERAKEPLVQVAHAVERSLRRLLRDTPAVALPVRLRALAPDELRSEEVLAELRQHDTISIELAAAVHELLGVRNRLAQGNPASAGDIPLAVQVADRLEDEVLNPAAPADAEPGAPLPGERWLASEPAEAEPEGEAPAGRPGFRLPWVLAAIALLLLIGAGVWWGRQREPSQLDQGIALFRSGAYQDAASHFYLYAKDHPDDVTPHLYLARIHRRLKRYDLARPELQRAAELAPDDPAVHTELGFFLLDLRQDARAVDRFRTAVKLDPASTPGWVGLVRALRGSGRAAEAERVLQQAPREVQALLRTPATPAPPQR